MRRELQESKRAAPFSGSSTQSIVFRNIRFATGSTGNRVDFLLAAIANNPNNGLTAADNVLVEISPDYGTTTTRSLQSRATMTHQMEAMGLPME